MMKHLPSREWRILILSALLVLSCGVYLNVRFTATLQRQAKVEEANTLLAEDRTVLRGKIEEAVVAGAAEAAPASQDACLEKAAAKKAGEMALIEDRVGAKPTAENVFRLCMKRYYGSEMKCIAWLNDEIRAALSRNTAARAGCLAQ